LEDFRNPLSTKDLKRLKRLTEVLISDVGECKSSEIAQIATSKLNRFGNADLKQAPLFMPIDVVMQLEAHSSKPHITAALAELNGSRLTVSTGNDRQGKSSFEEVVRRLKTEFNALNSAHEQPRAEDETGATRNARLLNALNSFEHSLVELKLLLGAR
jgi:hypothetical protein